MGNSISSWGSPKRVQGIINRAGLPLSVDETGQNGQEEGPISTFTEAYQAQGWFTGIKSSVTIPVPPAEVYQSLSKDLHNVFSVMTECWDEVKEDNGQGGQCIFRTVRIPFKVAFISGNLKLRLHVNQDSKLRRINFESAREGRLITRFKANFEILSTEEEGSVVNLDSRISAKSLPPPPFKGMVKDVIVRKVDRCMVDLVDFHAQRSEALVREASQKQLQQKASDGGLWTALRRSFSRSHRSLGKRLSLETQPSQREQRPQEP